MTARDDAVRRVGIDGLHIAYQRAGEGRPVVLLHGFFGDHRVWRRQFELADDWTVVAWDAPGCGGSSSPPATFQIAEYADLLAEFIASLGLDRPHVVGNSFGGALALELAARHPSIPASLVVNGGYAGWSGSFPPEAVAERLRRSLPDLDLPPEEVVSRWMPGFVTSSAPPSVVHDLGRIISDFRPDGMRVMIRALAEADLRAGLPRVTLPTLLVWGEEDIRSPLAVAEDIHA
ncbi:MAG: alpha/beta fold hydrolase [Chloroflexota bacterium]